MRRPCAADLQALRERGEVEALTICLINAYINGEHERRVAEIAAEIFGDTPISMSATWCRRCRSTSARKPPWSIPTCARRYRATSAICSGPGERWAGCAAVDPALRRRPGLGAGRGRIAGEPAHERPRRRCCRRDLFLRAGGLSRHPDLRHGRHLHGCGPDPGRARAGAPRDHRRRCARARTVRRRAHRRRRRRFHRLCARADQGAARRARVRRRRAGPGLLHEGRRGADGLRRQRGAGLPALGCAARRQDGDQPRGLGRPCRKWPTPWVSI
jgi:hypothetical protein